METLVGVVNKVIYDDPKNDFKVFQLRRKDRSLIRIAGEFPVLLQGTKVEVHGKYKNHPKYGVSFNSEAHTFDYDSDASSICLYIQSIAKWVGPERAWAMAKLFGNNLQEIIEKTPERLSEVEGIGEKVAASIAEAWEMNRDMKGIRIFLHGLGLTQGKIKRIVTMFGPETEDILKDNPWRLYEHGFGFSTCDHIANKLEKDMRCPTRFRYFILHILKECLNTGHLFLYPQQIIDAFNVFNRKTPYTFKEGDFDVYDIAPHIKVLITEGYLINDSNRLYQVENYFYENESARLLAKIQASKERSKLDSFDVEKFIKKYENRERASSDNKKFELSQAQRDALNYFVNDKVCIVTGGPGVGKTTLVKAMVQILKENNMEFELLTPTGIAAKKLGSTAGSEAYTIHRRLGYKGAEWNYNANVKYATDVIIVDEMSMVDQEVFYRLVSALYAKTRVVFVGDNDQLPSVGPGCVLRELINSGLIKTIFLNKIFRQENCSDIIKAAKKIRDGDVDLSYFSSDKTKDIWFIREKDSDVIEHKIISFAKQLKDRAKDKGNKLAFQIITPRNQGPLSVETLNIALQEALNPKTDDKKEIIVNKAIIRKGDRVMIRKNNYELGVFNGDIGKVVFITMENITIDLEDFFEESRRVEIPMRIADDMVKLAYALTAHKSQGLEYPMVILPFIKAHGALLLQRNLLYTALTRAKKKVIVLGQASAIESAILNDKIQKRNTRFAERLKEWIQGSGTSMRNTFSNYSSFQNSATLERLLLLEERGG
jgi:exodeoxyribonuclease V alpha subunit